MVGSILGRLFGMKPLNTFFAISIGAVIGCLLIAYFADAILSVFVKNFLFGLLIIIIIVVIGIMIWIYKKNNNSLKKQ
jgi:FtsH-binding integral membrane protein